MGSLINLRREQNLYLKWELICLNCFVFIFVRENLMIENDVVKELSLEINEEEFEEDYTTELK